MADARDPPIRKTVGFPAPLWAEVSEFRHGARIGTESAALARLVRAGLRAEARDAAAAAGGGAGGDRPGTGP